MRWLICLFLVFSSCNAQEVPACSTILHYVQKNLPQRGILKNAGGFVYVDLDDEYIHALIPFIQDEGFEEPPYFGARDLVGAHISVIYSDEMKKYGIQEIQECGELIDFIPIECQIVHPIKWQEMEEVYFIVVEAPQLDLIREKYGLPKRAYPFHITIGVKRAHLMTSRCLKQA